MVKVFGEVSGAFRYSGRDTLFILWFFIRSIILQICLEEDQVLRNDSF
jgi:hypothetical protein